MSKANSRIFVLIGLGVCLLATIPLIFGLVGSTTMGCVAKNCEEYAKKLHFCTV